MENNYREMRKRAELSSTDAAAKLGVSLSTLMNWEAGRTSPDGYRLVAMARLYRCTADELLALTEVRC